MCEVRESVLALAAAKRGKLAIVVLAHFYLDVVANRLLHPETLALHLLRDFSHGHMDVLREVFVEQFDDVV